MHDETPAGEDGSGGGTGGWASGAGLADLTGKQIGRICLGNAWAAAASPRSIGPTTRLWVRPSPSSCCCPAPTRRRTADSARAMTARALRHPNIVRILQIGGAHGPGGVHCHGTGGGAEPGRHAQRARPAAPRRERQPPGADRPPWTTRTGRASSTYVKPGNILLWRPNWARPQCPVGVAGLSGHSPPLGFRHRPRGGCAGLTSAGRTVGTPAYMAPEQCAGSREVDGRADLYALGAVLYRTITGRLPFAGSTTQICMPTFTNR